MNPLASEYDYIIAALCLWREARGTSQEAKLGVMWVLINRLRDPRPLWSHKGLAGVVLQPEQFSSFNANDPNSSKMPAVDDPAFIQCCEIVASPGLSDPTMGATNYFSVPMPDGAKKWADPAKFTVQIGPFRFYKL